MWLLVGLGNPGDKYKNNRHNVGFMVLDAIADYFSDFSGWRLKFQGQVSEGRIGGSRMILLKPETYMNLSGESVIKAAQFYKIEPDRIFVFHDELDIASMDVRIKKGGGNAGHNGLKSIQQHLGTPDFWRVRIGIGRPLHKGAVSNYVLDDYSKEERRVLEPLMRQLVRHVDCLVKGDPKLFEKEVMQSIKADQKEKD